MAEVKISELTSATTPLAGTETVPIVQGGVTKKVAVSNFGGASGIHAFVKPKSGEFITAMLANGGFGNFTQNISNKILLVPFIPAQNISYQYLSFNVVNGGVGTPNARILIYSDSNGLPTTKLYESADIPTGFAGYQSVSVSGTFVKGTTYWIGLYTNSSDTWFDSYPTNSLLTITYSMGETFAGISRNTTYGSAPTTIASASLSYVNSLPTIFIS